MKFLKHFVAGCLLLFASNASAAVILSAVPGFTDAMPGDSVTIDIVVSGLDAGGPDSLGAFDLDILYDAAALSVTDITVGSLLGDFGLGEAIDFSFGDLGGVIDLAVVSLLFDFELDALQPSDFTLASIDFSVDVLPDGTSTEVSFGPSVLSDAFGFEIFPMGTTSAVIANGIINEPGILALLMVPLFLVFRRQRNR
ncbi:MAG: hypothetical protein Alis3KO_09520 [Aliiglaciecola sp.]